MSSCSAETVTRLRDRFTRAEATPGSPARPRSTVPMHPAQCMPGTAT